MKVQIINKSRHSLPAYATEHAAGMDIRAHLDTPVELRPGQRAIIPTGLFLAIPEGHEVQIRPRSGLAAKHGITVLNAPGTIDADYRGEVGVILINMSDEAFVIQDGERVAQMVLASYAKAEWTETNELQTTNRGAGGFGSTGKQ